jgi:hypothetical protein
MGFLKTTMTLGLISITCFSNVLFAIENLPKKATTKKYKPREELMVIQTVSVDRHNFVVNKGIKDGVIRGQEIIFANENVSILCKSIEVMRNYSLWTPVGTHVNIPFQKDEIVSYNSYAYGNVAIDIMGDVNDINGKIIDYNEVFKKFRTSNNYTAKFSINRGLTQSSSDVSTGNNSNRTGYGFILEYNYRFMPEFEMNFGGRVDNEVYRLTSPELDIPTTRIMATIGATYHLLQFTSNQNNFYLALVAGIGQSKTTIDGVISSGRATLLPEARLGFIMPLSSQSAAMVLESSVESITAKEKVANETEQVTSMANVKFTIGLIF